MTKLVVLKLDGDLSQEVRVTLEMGEEDSRPLIQISGSLPAATDMTQVYHQWQDSYHRLGRAARITPGTTIIDGNITSEKCLENAELVRSRLNKWLDSESFRPLRETWLQELKRDEEVRVLISTSSESLRQLPWQLWDLIENYPLAEVALSATQYKQPASDNRPSYPKQVRILAILGDSTGIDVDKDKQLLEELPHANTTFLVEPHPEEIKDQLWEYSWEILFFAGHSQSEGETGRIYINDTDSLTIADLKYSLENAVRNGLQLAIFNSCDGLGLARELQHLRIPQLIVMREPVPDEVAQRFLKYFLKAFTGGEKFYLAERTARRRLRDLEKEFPCASWLPVIFQHPAVVPPTWNQLCGRNNEMHQERQAQQVERPREVDVKIVNQRTTHLPPNTEITKTCNYCGATNPITANFCLDCGKALTEAVLKSPLLPTVLPKARTLISNFFKGKPVDSSNFFGIRRKPNLEWKEIADSGGSPGEAEQVVSTISVKVFISHRASDLDLNLAQQLNAALQTDGYEVFMSGVRRPVTQGLSEIAAELRQCDYLLLLLSAQSAVSEMVTEEVRRAKELRNSSPNQKPVILTICVDLPLNAPLNHDLRGYLKKTWQREWQSGSGTVAPLVQEILLRLRTGDFPASAELVAGLATQLPEMEQTSPPLPFASPELPEGQVEQSSAFYVERPPIEARCYATIGKPGALIRIKAPRQMGKTSLMARILAQADKLGYLTVPLSFQLADAAVFSDLDKFLQWFCASVSWQLELPDKLTEYWNNSIGSKMSCTTYFERYIFPAIVGPLALGLDEVDLVFTYPEIAADFFGLLRAWHEYGRSREAWKRLRLVVVHSTEVYVPLNMNQSPFNVGLPIELPEFSPEQVQDLAQRHQLNWHHTQVQQLMTMVGGHPFLVRLALYHLAQQEMTLSELLSAAPTEAGLYSDHLRRHLWNLEKYPELAVAMKVVSATSQVRLEAVQAFKLHSMGLVHRQGNDVTPRCELYRQYFKERLGGD